MNRGYYKGARLFVNLYFHPSTRGLKLQTMSLSVFSFDLSSKNENEFRLETLLVVALLSFRQY